MMEFATYGMLIEVSNSPALTLIDLGLAFPVLLMGILSLIQPRQVDSSTISPFVVLSSASTPILYRRRSA